MYENYINLMCRVCQAPEKTLQNIFSMFVSNSRDIQIAAAIMECAPVKIVENDTLPSLICANCFETLKIAYEFKEKCIQSDVELRNQLSLIIKEKLQVVNNKTSCDSPLYSQDNTSDDVITDTDLFSPKEIDTPCETVDKTNTCENKAKKKIRKPSKTFKKQIKKRPKVIKEKEKKVIKSYKKLNESIETKRKNSKTKIYQCEYCNKVLSSQKTLKNHRLLHTGPIFTQCDICNHVFRSRNYLSTHKKKFHSNVPYVKKVKLVEKTFQCHCGKLFRTNFELVGHAQVHTDVKNFMCHICGKLFRVWTNLKMHLQVHSGRTFKCEFCEKMFTTRSDRRKHVTRLHEEKQTFQCSQCEKCFSDRVYLGLHERTVHKGHAPHKCDMCDRSFGRKGTLDVHRRVHTGEKPYRCNLCGKQFTQHSPLSRHLKTQHANEVHDNQVPDYTFAAASKAKYKNNL